MKNRKRTILDDSESDTGADSDKTVKASTTANKKKATARKRTSPRGTTQKKAHIQNDSDDAAKSSTPANKTKVTARKRGRPSGTTKKKAQIIQDDSDDGGDQSTRPNTPHANNDTSGDNSSDSDNAAKSSTPANKTKVTARKKGRSSGTTKKKTQVIQDDSDDDGSTGPNTPNNVNDEDDSSDPDFSVDSINKSKRIASQASAINNKRQRLLNNSFMDSLSQPSTSQSGTFQTVPDTESDSGSSSEDSDCGPINEKSSVKKKTSVQQSTSKTVNSGAVKKKVNSSKLRQTNEVSIDLKQVENLAQKLVQFLFVEDQKKYAIRRKAIVTHVFKDEYSPKLYAPVIKKANLFLKKIYGMELMELENQKDSYIIVNILGKEYDMHEYVDISRTKQQQQGLLLFLLTVIYMNENVITEDELTRSLIPLGIDLTTKKLHPVFGDVKRYITTELVKQMYLNYECVSKEPPKYEFTWGLRAKQEVDKRDLLQFACKIMDDTSPEDWRIQFRDAEASAKNCK